MSPDQARPLLLRAMQALDHIEGKTRVDRQARDLARRLLTQVLSNEETLPPLPVPEGARQGISVEPRADWRRR